MCRSFEYNDEYMQDLNEDAGLPIAIFNNRLDAQKLEKKLTIEFLRSNDISSYRECFRFADINHKYKFHDGYDLINLKNVSDEEIMDNIIPHLRRNFYFIVECENK